MRIQSILAIGLRQFYLIRGSFSRVVPLFAWVAVDIVLWGFITKYLNNITGNNMNFVPTMLGAVLIWDFFVRVMQGVIMAFLEDVWSRNFLNIFSTPLRISEYIGGLILSAIATSSIGLIVMLALATLVFGLSFFMYGSMLVVFLGVLFLFGIALGVLASAMALRLGPAAEWFIWPIPAFLSPFAGVFYPVSTLPQWMQYVAKILPPSYVFEGMRAIVHGESFAPSTLIIGAGLAALYVLLSAYVFSRVYKHAIRSGLIARYSAESVS